MNRFIKTWKEVRDKMISICFSENEQKGIIHIPEANVEIPNGLRMLDFLFQEEIENQFEFTSENPEKYFREQEEKLPGFMIRVHFLVNFVVMFEGILNRSYTNSIAVLRKYNSEVKVAEKQRSKRWTEIKDFKFWRNKVFSHTSYASPSVLPEKPRVALCESCQQKWDKFRKENEDNMSTQFSSLMQGLAGGIAIGDKSFYLPGPTAVIGGVQPEQFPKLSILESIELLEHHYEEWINMYIRIIDTFSTKEDFSKFSNIDRVSLGGKRLYIKNGRNS